MRQRGPTTTRRRAAVLAAALAVLLAPAARAADTDAEPEYPHGEFEDDCTLCHRDDAWRPARISDAFDHAARGFALRGSHATAACRSCHATLDFSMTRPDCVSCHADVHRDELGIDCAECHTPRSFIDRTRMIRRHTTTRFPLNGAHLATDCEDCHRLDSPGANQWVNTPWECESCHLQEYQATTEPNHETAGFPRDCVQCHNTRAFEDASFNHGLLPPEAQCRDCHLDDFLATTNPDHQAAMFPEDCEACHSTIAWVPATFRDHDQQYFPIFSGRHRGAWDECGDCHTTPNDYSTFDCLGCHDNEQELTNQHQDEAPGFQYTSEACYTCHPDGRAED